LCTNIVLTDSPFTQVQLLDVYPVFPDANDPNLLPEGILSDQVLNLPTGMIQVSDATVNDTRQSPFNATGMRPLAQTARLLGLSSTLNPFHEFRTVTHQNTVSQTNTGTVNLDSISIPTGMTYTVEALITGSLTDMSDVTSGRLLATVNGTLGLIGTVNTTVQASTTGTFTAIYAANAITIHVTPPTANPPTTNNPYNWVTTLTRQVLQTNQ
jgi:hypothetical protein